MFVDTALINLEQTVYSVDEGDSYISVCAVVSTCIEVYMPTVTLTTGDIDALGKSVVRNFRCRCKLRFIFLIIYAI